MNRSIIQVLASIYQNENSTSQILKESSACSENGPLNVGNQLNLSNTFSKLVCTSIHSPSMELTVPANTYPDPWCNVSVVEQYSEWVFLENSLCHKVRD